VEYSSTGNNGVGKHGDRWIVLSPLINDGIFGVFIGIGGDNDGWSFRDLIVL
jgi:hypothetical protein